VVVLGEKHPSLEEEEKCSLPPVFGLLRSTFHFLFTSILRPVSSTNHLTTFSLSPTVYALLINRVYYLRLAEQDLSFQALQITRADLCELLAIKLVRTFAGTDIELVDVLSRPWNPFQGQSALLFSFS
jgi:hypothetical protein